MGAAQVHFESQLNLADDGCFVETGSSHSAHMRYNVRRASAPLSLVKGMNQGTRFENPSDNF